MVGGVWCVCVCMCVYEGGRRVDSSEIRPRGNREFIKSSHDRQKNCSIGLEHPEQNLQQLIRTRYSAKTMIVKTCGAIFFSYHPSEFIFFYCLFFETLSYCARKTKIFDNNMIEYFVISLYFNCHFN